MAKKTSDTPIERPERKRRADGERSRSAILHEAAQLATVEGINGLSISRLAEAVGMSKSGLFAHFGSKEELQLATVEMAGEVFAGEVTGPAAAGETGIERLRMLCENFLHHVERGAYPGGCFFASVTAEVDTQAGPVRDAVLEVENDFFERIEKSIREAQAEQAIDAAEEPEQLAFELGAYLVLANGQYVITQDASPTDRARRALSWRLAAAGAPA